MSGGGGSSSDSGGGNDMQVSGMEAAISKEKGISTHADTRVSSTSFHGRDDGHGEFSGMGEQHHANEFEGATTPVGHYAGVTPHHASINPKTGKFESGGFVDSDDEYDTPDKAHWKDTQKQIKEHGADVQKMSDEEYKQFNKELNEYYGTEGVKYEPYGRAGQGTVNLSFKEHWDNIGMQHPMSRIMPLGRFILAAGRNIGEYFKSDYGTYKYGGPNTDKGGLLGRIGTGDGGSWAATEQDRAVMNKLAPDAPYIVSGQEQPDSVAQKWFDNTNSNQNEFFFKNQYSTAKAKQLSILGKPSPYRWLAVSQSPYYDFLKRNNLDRGIL